MTLPKKEWRRSSYPPQPAGGHMNKDKLQAGPGKRFPANPRFHTVARCVSLTPDPGHVIDKVRAVVYPKCMQGCKNFCWNQLKKTWDSEHLQNQNLIKYGHVQGMEQSIPSLCSVPSWLSGFITQCVFFSFQNGGGPAFSLHDFANL